MGIICTFSYCQFLLFMAFFLISLLIFYLRYPEATESFKFGNRIFSVLQIIYMLFFFSSLGYLSRTSDYINILIICGGIL